MPSGPPALCRSESTVTFRSPQSIQTSAWPVVRRLGLIRKDEVAGALFGMMRLDLSAPDYTTLSRRSQHFRRRLRLVPPGEGLHLVLDSTGLSLVGAGE